MCMFIYNNTYRNINYDSIIEYLMGKDYKIFITVKEESSKNSVYVKYFTQVELSGETYSQKDIEVVTDTEDILNEYIRKTKEDDIIYAIYLKESQSLN
ncbi:hypothetical protein ENUP19_0059G0017 [Entamoeba nuttalli]|uniref:Uncharacterized protein n=1 Tax=Entamoeba nuttalli TaxID=412467 RepID=A0ABQ0DD66_9EUKA